MYISSTPACLTLLLNCLRNIIVRFQAKCVPGHLANINIRLGKPNHEAADLKAMHAVLRYFNFSAKQKKIIS